MIYRTKEDAWMLNDSAGKTCWQCEEALNPPFVVWNGGETTITVCPQCAEYLARGLVSDAYSICSGQDAGLGGSERPGADHATAYLWGAARIMRKFPDRYHLGDPAGVR